MREEAETLLRELGLAMKTQERYVRHLAKVSLDKQAHEAGDPVAEMVLLLADPKNKPDSFVSNQPLYELLALSLLSEALEHIAANELDPASLTGLMRYPMHDKTGTSPNPIHYKAVTFEPWVMRQALLQHRPVYVKDEPLPEILEQKITRFVEQCKNEMGDALAEAGQSVPAEESVQRPDYNPYARWLEPPMLSSSPPSVPKPYCTPVNVSGNNSIHKEMRESAEDTAVALKTMLIACRQDVCAYRKTHDTDPQAREEKRLAALEFLSDTLWLIAKGRDTKAHVTDLLKYPLPDNSYYIEDVRIEPHLHNDGKVILLPYSPLPEVTLTPSDMQEAVRHGQREEYHDTYDPVGTFLVKYADTLRIDVDCGAYGDHGERTNSGEGRWMQ